jgi:hypothetical protein
MREVRTADEYGITVSRQRIDWPSTVARVRATVDRVRSIKREAERFAEARSRPGTRPATATRSRRGDRRG